MNLLARSGTHDLGAGMFVRFVTATPYENPWRADGIFRSDRAEQGWDQLSWREARQVDSVFGWFRFHLPCPPFTENLTGGRWSRDAVCWFECDARAHLARVQELLEALDGAGVSVRRLQCADPGTILYRDQFQVVAETPWERACI